MLTIQTMFLHGMKEHDERLWLWLVQLNATMSTEVNSDNTVLPDLPTFTHFVCEYAYTSHCSKINQTSLFSSVQQEVG